MADAVGIPRSTFGRIANDQAAPSGEELLRLADYFDVSPRWLQWERGPMRPDATTIPDGYVLVPFYSSDRLTPEGRGEPSDRVPIPNSLIPRAIDPDVESWLTVMPSASMPEVAREGMTIVCRDPEEPLVDGAVYLFDFPKGLTARRVVEQADGLALTTGTGAAILVEDPAGLRPVARIVAALNVVAV